MRLPPYLSEIDPLFADRHPLGQFHRAPRAAEGVQLRFALFNLRAARVLNLELNGLMRRRGIDRALILPRDELPLRDFFRSVSRTIGESIDAPGLFFTIIAVTVPGAERLAIVAGGDGDELAGVSSVGQVKHRDAVLIGLFDALAPYPLLAVVILFPEL